MASITLPEVTYFGRGAGVLGRVGIFGLGRGVAGRGATDGRGVLGVVGRGATDGRGVLGVVGRGFVDWVGLVGSDADRPLIPPPIVTRGDLPESRGNAVDGRVAPGVTGN